MRFIYQTDNPIEAHVITHVLEQHGIMAQVTEDHSSHAGHFIGGSVNAKISVINEEAEEAYQLIKTWREETRNAKNQENQIKPKGRLIGDKESSPTSSYLLPIFNPTFLIWIGLLVAFSLTLLAWMENG